MCSRHGISSTAGGPLAPETDLGLLWLLLRVLEVPSSVGSCRVASSLAVSSSSSSSTDDQTSAEARIAAMVATQLFSRHIKVLHAHMRHMRLC